MRKENINFLERLLYNEDLDEVVEQLKSVNDSLLLHYYIANYNWDDGFIIPTVVLDNDVCDVGTGLLMFYRADGYNMLMDMNGFLKQPMDGRKSFLIRVYDGLINSAFKSSSISFDPELSKIQKYKLKKINPTVSDIFINKTQGVSVDIPNI